MAIGRLGVLLSMVVCAVAGWAQQPAAPVLNSGPATGPSPISLDVVVSPRGGAPVPGLTQQDFTVTDNKAPAAITSFRALGGKDAPVEVIVVIDDVNTVYTTVAYERGEIEKFFKANGGKLAYPTQLAIVSDTGTQIQRGFSTDGAALSESLEHDVIALRDIRRSAGFYGATDRLQVSIRALQQIVSYGTGLPGRKVVLWVSPGWPILNGPNVEISGKDQQAIFDTIVSLSTAFRQARITLYSVDPLGTQDAGGFHNFYYQNFLKGIRKPGDTGFGNLALQVFATQTGGQVLNSSNDIAGLLQKAMSDTNAYYELSFDPSRGEPNEYHQIDVKVAKPGLVARTRNGYYSQP
jgi:VWFA-related protein